ncbi:MAG: hypothetical protein WCY26_06205 [Thiohalobacteraceae bacterium]|nr:hypothetical protein [Ottowia sp.]
MPDVAAGRFVVAVVIMIAITRFFARGLLGPGPSPVFGAISAVAGLVSLRLRQALPWQRVFKRVKKGQLS